MTWCRDRERVEAGMVHMIQALLHFGIGSEEATPTDVKIQLSNNEWFRFKYVDTKDPEAVEVQIELFTSGRLSTFRVPKGHRDKIDLPENWA